jgi:hypothetical protein
MLLLANDDNVVLPPLHIILDQFLASTLLVAIRYETISSYVHEGNADHTQAYNHNLFPFAVTIDLALLL